MTTGHYVTMAPNGSVFDWYWVAWVAMGKTRMERWGFTNEIDTAYERAIKAERDLIKKINDSLIEIPTIQEAI